MESVWGLELEEILLKILWSLFDFNLAKLHPKKLWMPVFNKTAASVPENLPQKNLCWSPLLEKTQFPILGSSKGKICKVEAVTLKESLGKKWSFPLRISSVCDQIRSFQLIWSHLLRKPLMENYIFLQWINTTIDKWDLLSMF